MHFRLILTVIIYMYHCEKLKANADSKIPPAIKNARIASEELAVKMISPNEVQAWADKLSEKFLKIEERVVRSKVLRNAFSNFPDIKQETRNGSDIVEKMAAALGDLLNRRAQAAANIMRKAEVIANESPNPPEDYKFDKSKDLDIMKKEQKLDPISPWELPENCIQLRKYNLTYGTHFGSGIGVTFKASSVQVAAEVFPCDERIIRDFYWSEGLLPTFKQNFAQDATTDFQYFCSAKGFLRHYPGALWQSMFQLTLNPDDDDDNVADVFDCRLRPWYVAASGAPRDVLILLDASGSMSNSSNLVHAEQFTSALLSALTDDDQVNVLRFNVVVQSPITCFNNKLVSANYINSAAMMSALRLYPVKNESDLAMVLEVSVNLLHQQKGSVDRPPSCQQAIVLITDSIYLNFTDLMRNLDPSGRIRLFVIWLHDPHGLRDNTREFGEWLSCSRDGYFAELVTDADVTEQVIQILRVLERPLVAQRKERIVVFSDIYAHVEDPRRSEHYWVIKEREEQAYRYKELRRDKKRLMDPARLYKDYMRQESLEKFGQYYEGQDVDYRLRITVSVPVFEATTSEEITKKVDLEKDIDDQRNSTRTYPVNRLLGVAGIDIPIDHLKLIFPYHRLGAGGSLFLIDHRGNIVLHENTKPTFDGNILKPGYRTVEMLDLEQPGIDLLPREYSLDWLEFRKTLVIDQPKGNRTMFGKHIFEDGMRATLEMKEYHWRRVLEHYTAVVVMPKYNRRHAVVQGAFTKQLAEAAEAVFSRSELSIHPDWLYCRHVDPYFDERELEVLHFIKRRKDEPDFQMQKLKYMFSPIKHSLHEKPYQCNEELMVQLCREVIATAKWAEEYEESVLTDKDCITCEFGSLTAFFASGSGLTRWVQYHATSPHANPPSGSEWPRGPNEAWYKRAAARPDTLIIHAPVLPLRKKRNSDATPPVIGVNSIWLTAARSLDHPDKGHIGVGGFHFYPQHLEDVLRTITNFTCTEDDNDDCKPRCDGTSWTCVLVDEGGWIVAGHWKDEKDATEEDPVREHLARVHPQAMYALLTAGVFKLHWVHDYQAVCFPPQDEMPASAAMMPSILRSLWRSVHTILMVTKEAVTILTLITSGGLVAAETEAEKEKRRRRLRKDYMREKFERLYDIRVLVNRTRFAACDRSRALYELQRTQKAMEALKREPKACSWPLAGAVVPKTNLLLLAVYNLCKHEGRPIPDPLANEPVDMSNEEWANKISANKLACWRNRVSLPTRPPHTTCYPHNYSQEEGYRQCGPWLPNPEKKAGAQTGRSTLLFYIAIIILVHNI